MGWAHAYAGHLLVDYVMDLTSEVKHVFDFWSLVSAGTRCRKIACNLKKGNLNPELSTYIEQLFFKMLLPTLLPTLLTRIHNGLLVTLVPHWPAGPGHFRQVCSPRKASFSPTPADIPNEPPDGSLLSSSPSYSAFFFLIPQTPFLHMYAYIPSYGPLAG